jgi:outer membrane protein assembly factor BamD (BamD/ComL family)
VVDADALEGDVRQLSEAQRAMQQGDTDKALALLDSRNATGPLAAERAGARALALCQAGRLDEGARVAAQFLRTYPTSPMAARVRAACSTPSRRP